MSEHPKVNMGANAGAKEARKREREAHVLPPVEDEVVTEEDLVVEPGEEDLVQSGGLPEAEPVVDPVADAEPEEPVAE